MKNISSMGKAMKLFKNFFIKFDFYGHPVELYMDSKSTVRSRFGALISISIIILCMIILINNFNSWMMNENLQTISSSKSFTAQELLNLNQSLEYIFDDNNYYIYFSLFGVFKNATIIRYDDLRTFFTQKLYYRNKQGAIEDLAFENCLDTKKNAFLLQENKNFNNISLSYDTLCIPSNLQMGLFANYENRMVMTPNIIYSLTMCKNSSLNNFSCASNEEIINLLQDVTLQIGFPRSIYDFKDTKMPRKRSYDYQSFIFDADLVKMYTGFLMPVYLHTDKGILQESYELDSLDFNLEKLVLETKIRKEGEILFSLVLNTGLNQQSYYRKNQKLYDLFANLGGFINIVFIVGKFLCSFYNKFVFRHKLVNIIFNNNEKEKNSKFKPKNPFSFSLSPFLCPKLSNNKIYTNAIKNIHEYMDIKNIIKRLQDIDKLKMVLLDEKQKKVFEILPKPCISNQKQMKTSIFTIDKVIENKKNSILESDYKTNFGFLLNGDPINSRMYSLLDTKIKMELKNSHKCNFFISKK